MSALGYSDGNVVYGYAPVGDKSSQDQQTHYQENTQQYPPSAQSPHLQNLPSEPTTHIMSTPGYSDGNMGYGYAPADDKSFQHHYQANTPQYLPSASCHQPSAPTFQEPPPAAHLRMDGDGGGQLTNPPLNLAELSSAPPTAVPVITPEEITRLPTITHKGEKKDIESWDSQLNDPKLLYDWIRYKVLTAPRYKIKVECFHKELEPKSDPNSTHNKSKKVQDFCCTFVIPLCFNGNTTNIQLWTRPDQEPTERGTDSNSRGGPSRTTAERQKDKIGFNDMRTWRGQMTAEQDQGIPPWSGARATLWALQDAAAENAVGLNPLQQWCEAFCRDPSAYKSFVVEKHIWGYQEKEINQRIENALRSHGYKGKIEINGWNAPDHITVRPDNGLVRFLRSAWRFLLYITFIYCCIMCWRRASKKGGAKYDIAIASYGLCTYPPLPGTYDHETLDVAQRRLDDVKARHPELKKLKSIDLVRGPQGVHYRLGKPFEQWLDETCRAVLKGTKGVAPLPAGTPFAGSS